MLTVHVVSHTHWDREWYHPAERFRQRLVELIDELLDDPATDGFLLDGQTVVLEDYLELRPERASELAAALRQGKVEAGPWFVLPDELIPGGEGLVRNLLAGRHTLRALRADSPPVLYCPDSFGHPAALPDLARGFGKETVILWRGFGGARGPEVDSVWWSAPGGARVLLHHLTRSGYELGSNLPADPAAARERWARIRREFGSRPGAGIALLLNGADHHARQRQLAAALSVLGQAAKPDVIEASSLTRYQRELATRVAGQSLPDVSGELRDSYGFTWTLQGTLASRTPQKRRYAMAEQELVRDAEPWAAIARFQGARSRRHLTRAAWRPLLLCQPHDTLCGCSIDAVARAMDARLETVSAQAAGLREDSVHDLVGHDREAARQSASDWRSVVLVRNRAARPRSGVAIVEFSVKLTDIPVGPGSRHVRYDAQRGRLSHPTWPVEPSQLLDAADLHERTESPRAYPDNDMVAHLWSAVWVDDVPAYGVLSVPTTGHQRPPSWVPKTVTVKGRSMANEHLTLRWDARGRITLEQPQAGRTIRGLLEWESLGDSGDLYTPSIRRKKLAPRLRGTTVVHRGPLSAAVEQRWMLASRGERVDIRLRLVLDAGAAFLRVGVLGDNSALDHRLRLRFRTDIKRGVTVADAAFGPVERAPLTVPAKHATMETVVPTAPLHRYVSLFDPKRGATLFSDGSTEYESTGSDILVTLLRSVGELSRSDIPERPGHAGWPAPTPDAQCLGPFEAEFGLLLHGPRAADTIDEIERASDDVLLPLVGETLRSALHVAPPVHGVELLGQGLALSAIKESDDGEWLVLRCVNRLEERTTGFWKLARAPNEVRLARLDETVLEPLPINRETVAFQAGPREIVTILVR
jgi:alpha-mannosidase